MKIKDFKITKQVKKDSLKKTTHSFCELCFRVNPNTEDGYTTCCNERSVSKSEALEMAKSQDVMNYLNTKFEVSISNANYSSSSAKVELPNKKKVFNLSMTKSEEDIAASVLENIKGLRKEK